MSNVERLRAREEEQTAWLLAHHPEVFAEQRHLDEGSQARAYWHYGYLVALRDVLKLLQPPPQHNRNPKLGE